MDGLIDIVKQNGMLTEADMDRVNIPKTEQQREAECKGRKRKEDKALRSQRTVWINHQQWLIQKKAKQQEKEELERAKKEKKKKALEKKQEKEKKKQSNKERKAAEKKNKKRRVAEMNDDDDDRGDDADDRESDDEAEGYDVKRIRMEDNSVEVDLNVCNVCPCQGVDGEMMECENCKQWQHTACIPKRLMPKNKKRDPFLCESCFDSLTDLN